MAGCSSDEAPRLMFRDPPQPSLFREGGREILKNERKCVKYLQMCGKVRTFAAVQWNVGLEKSSTFLFKC